MSATKKVAQTFGKRVAGNTGAIATSPIKVVGNQRNKPGEAEIHENVADVFMVMEGSINPGDRRHYGGRQVDRPRRN